MKFILALVAITAFLPTFSKADTDVSNGSLIAEPSLSDYHVGERTPGFSAITDVVDANGN